MIEAMSDPFRILVYSLVAERPGVTIKDLAARSNQPARRIRHQLEWLREAGLVEVERRTTTRNTRQAHYRATILPRIDDTLPEGDERKVALATLKLTINDLALALSDGRIGKPGSQSLYRLPGPVDEEGLEEIAATLGRAVGEIEESMRSSARRLGESGAAGIQLTTILGFFEMPPWKETSEGSRSGWEESGPETPN